jgi:hypothetical protein
VKVDPAVVVFVGFISIAMDGWQVVSIEILLVYWWASFPTFDLLLRIEPVYHGYLLLS